MQRRDDSYWADYFRAVVFPAELAQLSRRWEPRKKDPERILQWRDRLDKAIAESGGHASRDNATEAQLNSKSPDGEGALEQLRSGLALGSSVWKEQTRDSADPAGKALAQVLGPSPSWGLVGLAVSGGGIRAASIAVGALQALTERDLIKRVDYISSVSGGGYAAAAYMNAVHPPPTREPMGLPALVGHLRNRGSYVGGRGTLTQVSALAHYVGTFMVHLLLASWIPAGLAAALYVWRNRLTSPLAHLLKPDTLPTVAPLNWLAGQNMPLLYLALCCLALAAPCVLISSRCWPSDTRPIGDQGLAPVGRLAPWAVLAAAGIAWAHTVGWPTDAVLSQCVRLEGPQALACRLWPSLAAGPGLLLLTAFGGAVATTGATWARMFRRMAPTAPRVDALTVVACVLGAIVFVEGSPWAAEALHGLHSSQSTGNADPTTIDDLVSGGAIWSILAALGGAVGAITGRSPEDTRTRRLAFHIGVLLACSIPALLFIGWIDLLNHHIEAHQGLTWKQLTQRPVLAGLLAMQLVLAACSLLVLDVNRTSILSVYRDGLRYLYFPGQGHPDGPPAPQLSDFAESPGPLPILNFSHNLHGAASPPNRGRNSTNFAVTPLFAGNSRCGFTKTETLQAHAPELDLPTCIAISGAAAAPTMGRYSSSSMGLAMTLLNVRMGLWIPRPSEHQRPPSRQRSIRSWRTTPNLRHLLAEALGQVADLPELIHVSDGGHLENTGAFELIRRRARLIFVIDAEHDPEYKFIGFRWLQEISRVDLGASIDINLESMRPSKDGRSACLWALGTITYEQEGATGHLLYLKSGLTGRESEATATYAASEPDFPHHPTSDQLFDESRFEAYRALGRFMVEEAFEGFEGASETELGEWLRHRAWSAFHTFGPIDEAERARRLAAISATAARLGQGSGRGNSPAHLSQVSASPPHAYATTLRQLDLMERQVRQERLWALSVWNDPKNQVWRARFEAWVADPQWPMHYALAASTVSTPMRIFMGERLGIWRVVLWEIDPERTQLVARLVAVRHAVNPLRNQEVLQTAISSIPAGFPKFGSLPMATLKTHNNQLREALDQADSSTLAGLIDEWGYRPPPGHPRGLVKIAARALRLQARSLGLP